MKSNDLEAKVNPSLQNGKKKLEHWEMYVVNCDKCYIKLIENNIGWLSACCLISSKNNVKNTKSIQV